MLYEKDLQRIKRHTMTEKATDGIETIQERLLLSIKLYDALKDLYDMCKRDEDGDPDRTATDIGREQFMDAAEKVLNEALDQ